MRHMAPAFPARLAGVLLAVVLVVSVTDWALTFGARRTMTEPVVVLPAGEVDPQARLTDVAPIARLFGAASSAEAGGVRAPRGVAGGAGGGGIPGVGVGGQAERGYRTGGVNTPGGGAKEGRQDDVGLSR